MANFQINRKLLPMKVYYFLFFAGLASMMPFMSVYPKQLGFSSVHVGIIFAILPLSGMLAKPFFGWVADRFAAHKPVFWFVQIIIVPATVAMIFLPSLPVVTKTNINFTRANSTIYLFVCHTINDTCANNILLHDKEVLCNLDCPLTETQRENICNEHDYCEDRFKFQVHLQMNLTDQREECIYFGFNSNITFDNGKTFFPNNSTIETIICEAKCDFQPINELLTKTILPQSIVVHRQHQFWLLFVVYLIVWIGQAVAVSMGDTVCFQLLGDRPLRYGYQRLYGSLGWGLFSVIYGLLLDYFSRDISTKNYTPILSIGVVILLLAITTSFTIQYTQPSTSKSIIRDIGHLLKRLSVVTFILCCVFIGITTSVMWNFYFWFLEDLAAKRGYATTAWIKTIQGLSLGVQCLVGEVFFFFISHRIIKLIGHVHSMNLVLLTTGIRFIAYSFTTNPWICIIYDVGNGTSFGLFFATTLSYTTIIAPDGASATMMGFVSAMFEGVGMSIGNLVAGILFQQYAGAMMFRIFGIITLIIFGIHVGVQLIIANNKKMHDDTNEREVSQEEAVPLQTQSSKIGSS